MAENERYRDSTNGYSSVLGLFETGPTNWPHLIGLSSSVVTGRDSAFCCKSIFPRARLSVSLHTKLGCRSFCSDSSTKVSSDQTQVNGTEWE